MVHVGFVREPDDDPVAATRIFSVSGHALPLIV
jgi:hypothetical protein